MDSYKGDAFEMTSSGLLTGLQLLLASRLNSFRPCKLLNVCFSMNVPGYLIATRSSAGFSLNVSTGNWILWPLGNHRRHGEALLGAQRYFSAEPDPDREEFRLSPLIRGESATTHSRTRCWRH